jgi:hypothetical protein
MELDSEGVGEIERYFVIWAFVDYENVGTLESLNLSEYERIFVFCGPKNLKIKFGSLPSNEFCKVEFIGITTVGANNLDFHLSFHLGRFHEVADSSVEFHIISNDAGFNGLVSHLKKTGRACKKVLTKTVQPAQAVQPKQPKEVALSSKLSECALLVVEKLKLLDGRKRPRKKASLLNWIKSQCQGLSNSGLPETIFDELKKVKIVRDSGTIIAYELPSGSHVRAVSQAQDSI